MTDNALASLEADDGSIDTKSLKRAQYGAYEFSIGADARTVDVQNGSYADADDHEYRVTADAEGIPTSCTCPAYEYHSGPCKHMLAVAIREPVTEALRADIETDDGEESRETSGQGAPEPIPDGGTVVESEPEPDDECNCGDLLDLPCWPCVRDGRRELPE